MGEYVRGWWNGLSQQGRAIISIVAVLCVLAAFWLALANAGAFASVTESLGKLLP